MPDINCCPMCGHDERRWSEVEILALWRANPDPVAFARALHLPIRTAPPSALETQLRAALGVQSGGTA